MQNSSRTTWVVVSVVWALAVSLLITIEWPRITELGLLNLVVSWNSETTLPAFALLLLPCFAVLFPAKTWQAKGIDQSAGEFRCLLSAHELKQCHTDAWCDGLKATKMLAVQSLLIAGLSLISSWSIGQTEIEVQSPTGEILRIPFAELPFAYHDEFSYLLQAETFAAKRLAWPAAPVLPDLFHQFHVLNEDVTVSRYFPLTGLWVVPSLLLGQPIWGHWIAGALSAVLFFWSAKMIMPPMAALLCGVLLALSPGLAIFSNMLLAHHPVILMLSLFLFSFLKLVQTGRIDDSKSRRRCVLWAFVAGTALSAAMLGRPMTAAGFAAPFGAWLLWEMISGRVSLKVVPAFAVPLLLGFAALAVMNAAATGDPLRTAYQTYTDNFTPRHKYGFDNALNCEIADGPMAVQKYDQWATNLTWVNAKKNLSQRIKFSLFWTWNLMLLGLGLIAAVVELIRLNWVRPNESKPSLIPFRKTALGVLLTGIVSLHVAHIPYWYAGIMEWHYVFETAPLIIMLATFGFCSFVQHSRRLIKSRVMTAWACGFLLSAMIPSWFSSPEMLGASKVSQWISQTSYSRRRIAEFNLAAASTQTPALIFVDESGTDPQLSFIINPPDYSGNILICRLPRNSEELSKLQAHFPDRKLFYFDAKENSTVIQIFDEAQHMPSDQ